MHGRKFAVEGINHQSDSLLHCYERSLHSFEDPFEIFLESVRKPKFSDFINNEFVFMFLNKLQECSEVKNDGFIPTKANLKKRKIYWCGARKRAQSRSYII